METTDNDSAPCEPTSNSAQIRHASDGSSAGAAVRNVLSTLSLLVLVLLQLHGILSITRREAQGKTVPHMLWRAYFEISSLLAARFLMSQFQAECQAAPAISCTSNRMFVSLLPGLGPCVAIAQVLSGGGRTRNNQVLMWPFHHSSSRA